MLFRSLEAGLQALAPKQFDARGGRETLASYSLLPAYAMTLCNLVWMRLKKAESDEVEVEALGRELLDPRREQPARSTSGTCRGPVSRISIDVNCRNPLANRQHNSHK